MRFNDWIIFGQFIWLVYLAIQLRNLKSGIKKAQNKSVVSSKKQEAALYRLHLNFENQFKIREFPSSLKSIPYADDLGIVTSVRALQIPSVSSPYNASIGHTELGNFLFFRYDTLQSDGSSLISHVGCIGLNESLEPCESTFTKIDTNSNFSEDARLFKNERQHYLVYNDFEPGRMNQRHLRIASIDLKTKQLKTILPLNSKYKTTEKNWTPFSYNGQIYFLYTIAPQRIFHLPNPENNQLNKLSSLAVDCWPSKWGVPRGGTPAQLVGGEYLAFFHSSFEDHKGVIWYIMGAYTFSPKPPFQLTRISPTPLLFNRIYDTVHNSIAPPRVRAIYPMGFIEQEESIHLSCGENDSGIKLITFNKATLLNSLIKINIFA